MLALCDRARNHEIAPSDSKNIFQKYNRMTTAFANPSELILDTLNNIDLESKLKGYALSLGSLSLASGTTQFNSSYEDVKIVNTQILLAGKNAKANYYALREKELVVMINVIGVLLFSAVVMFMVVHFPQHAWWLTMIVSGLAIGGICVGVFGMGAYSVITGATYQDMSNSSPLDATLSISMPFMIFSAILVVVAAAATFLIWYSARKTGA